MNLFISEIFLFVVFLMSYFKASRGAWPANGYLKSIWGKSLYKNSCCGKGTFILDYIQTVLKEWNGTKREIWFLLPVSPVNDTSFHLLIFLLAFSLLLRLQSYCDLETGNFTETNVFQVRCLSPLAKLCCCFIWNQTVRQHDLGFLRTVNQFSN